MDKTTQIKVVCVLGSTCTGKSDLALDLAKSNPSQPYEIINADAMQVFKGLEIATNKPTLEELSVCPHHMFSLIDPFPDSLQYKSAVDTPYHVSQYVKRVNELIQEIHDRGHVPIIVGGTNFYIKALFLSDFDMLAQENEVVDEKSDSYYTHDKLQSILPDLAAKLHPNDFRKIKNAILSYESNLMTAKSTATTLKYDPIFLYLSYDDRSALDRRIDQRVLKMIDRGLLDEVVQFYVQHEKEINLLSQSKNFAGDGIYRYGIFQCIGYKEFADYVNYKAGREEITQNEQEIVHKCTLALQQATRKYARRQESWFRNTWSTNPILKNRLFKLDASVETNRPTLTNDAIAICSQFLNNEPVDTKCLICIEDKPAEKPWKKIKCEDCNKVCNGELEYMQHIKSQAHKKKKRRTRKLKQQRDQVSPSMSSASDQSII